jgi:hypothetical protein
MKTERPKWQGSTGCENVLVGNKILDMKNVAFKINKTESQHRSMVGHLPSMDWVLILNPGTTKMRIIRN